METNDKPFEKKEERNYKAEHLRGRIAGGIIIIGIGVMFLLRELGMVFPPWLFSWKMLLLAFALYFTIKNLFRNFIWWIILLGAVAFISDDMFGVHVRLFAGPILIIIAGLYFIFRPKKSYSKTQWQHYKRDWDWKRYDHHWDWKEGKENNASEDFIEIVSCFGNSKSNVISKNFRGGDVVCVFGGAVLDLSQADIKGKVVLEITAVFGGAQIIIPANWKIQSQITAFLGGIEDKREISNDVAGDDTKVLLLVGTATFGGITIKS